MTPRTHETPADALPRAEAAAGTADALPHAEAAAGTADALPRAEAAAGTADALLAGTACPAKATSAADTPSGAGSAAVAPGAGDVRSEVEGP